MVGGAALNGVEEQPATTTVSVGTRPMYLRKRPFDCCANGQPPSVQDRTIESSTDDYGSRRADQVSEWDDRPCLSPATV